MRNTKAVTLLANSSERKQNDVTPARGLLSVELPSEGAVEQEGDEGKEAETGQPHCTTEWQGENVHHEGQGWRAEQKRTPGNTIASLHYEVAAAAPFSIYGLESRKFNEKSLHQNPGQNYNINTAKILAIEAMLHLLTGIP
jgi:hypothetical protein